MNGMTSLESRTFFSVYPVFELTSKGTLIVHGTAGDDAIVAFLTPHNPAAIRVTMSSSRPDPELQELSHTFQARVALVKRLRVEAGDGTNSVGVGAGTLFPRPTTILGGNGTDYIGWECSAPVFADGGPGDDSIGTLHAIIATQRKNRDVLDAHFAEDHGAVDTILGGNGNDTVVGDPNDEIHGGAGADIFQAVFSGEGKQITDARAQALGEDYFARLSLNDVESVNGFGVDHS